MQSTNPFAPIAPSPDALSPMGRAYSMRGTSDMSQSPDYGLGGSPGAPYLPNDAYTALFQASAEVPPFVISYRYWEDEAKTTLMSYDVQSLRRVIRYNLFRNENMPRSILQSRTAGIVQDFALGLATPREAGFIAELSHNQKVEEIIRRSRLGNLSYIPWTWFPPPNSHKMDPKSIAAAIDAESHLQFSRVPFEEWVRYSLGYRVVPVEWFLQQHTNLYIHLLNHLSGFPDEIQIYIEVEKALRNRSPFAHRALAECLLTLIPAKNYHIPISSKPAFEFIAGPIQRLFLGYRTNLVGMLKVLCVLAIRFRRTYVHSAQMDWHQPFDTDISFIKDLFSATSPSDFARTLTASDDGAFAKLSPQNLIAEDGIAQQYLARSHMLTLSVWECCSALSDWIKFIQDSVQLLLTLRNYHSAMAIIAGLQKYGTTTSTARSIPDGVGFVAPNPVLPPNTFYVMNPFQNYLAYRQQFEAMPGLPFLYPHIHEAKQLGRGVLDKVFLLSRTR